MATRASTPTPLRRPQAAPRVEPQKPKAAQVVDPPVRSADPAAVIKAPKPPTRIRIRVAKGFSIYVPPLGRTITPSETVELDEVDPWIRRQVILGTFVEV